MGSRGSTVRTVGSRMVSRMVSRMGSRMGSRGSVMKWREAKRRESVKREVFAMLLLL